MHGSSMPASSESSTGGVAAAAAGVDDAFLRVVYALVLTAKWSATLAAGMAAARAGRVAVTMIKSLLSSLCRAALVVVVDIKWSMSRLPNVPSILFGSDG